MSARNATVHVGYEVGSGEPVSLPLRNLAVTGQTQESGKTTTLEALATRSGATILTFVTKRGESSFESGRRIAPYFRDRADWQFVSSIIDATLQEKNKFLRPWIMKICRTTQTLKEVQIEVRKALKKATGVNEGVYTQLDAYLDLIVPEIGRARLAPKLDLVPGLNVMDVSSFATPMQMLFVQSALDWVNEQCRDTIVVIPEAWEFIPEGKGSPVKNSAETLVRKGSGIGNHIWVDSQDMAGVDKTILRGCPVWLIGVQREANEIKRNLSNIPAHVARPKPADIAMLDRGQFFACFGHSVRKVYVQPAWMNSDEAIEIARDRARIADAPSQKSIKAPAPIASNHQEDEVNKATADALIAENARLKEESAAAEQRGLERGIRLATQQAGEFWNAAALDLRDNAQKAIKMAEHLAGVAREGHWFVPRGAAEHAAIEAAVPLTAPSDTPESPTGDKPVAPKPAKPPAEADPSMLYPLVRSHPLALTGELWGIFLGLSAGTTKSGPWHRKVRTLTEAGLLEKNHEGFRATVAGIAASEFAPANPQDAVELWQIWRDKISEQVGDAALALLRILATHRNYRLSNEQLALLAGKAPGTARSGPWFTMLKTLREWELIEGTKTYVITAKGRVILPEGSAKAASDTAEALRQARYASLTNSKRHYDALDRPMTKRQLGEVLGIGEGTMKSGPWHGAIKELVDSKLVAERGGQLQRIDEELVPA